MNFKRRISLVGLLFAGISSVIGSGWLFGPLYAAQVAGPAACLAWAIGGILMLVIALTFAELGCAYPVAGGMIQYAQQSHGPLVSFVIGWMVWVSSVAVAPVETLGLLQYADNYLPNLMVKTLDGSRVLSSFGIICAALLMMLMVVLNFYGAKFFSRANNIITLIKLIVPISTVLILLFANFNSRNFTATAQGGFTPFGWQGIVSALPLGGVIYSFIGSNTILQLAGETKNPQKSIPFALIGSMLFCILLYSALQIAFIGALPTAALAKGWNSIQYHGDIGPFSGLMLTIGLAWFSLVIYADAIISPFGTGFVFTASTARVSYGVFFLKAYSS
jgi:amino acid transporter